MGWLDKTFKNIIKSPLGKAAIMGGLAMTPWGKGIMGLMGKHGGTKGMGMLANLWAKPLISKPLTNAAMSYGLAKLTRAKNPEQAALWGAGMTLPFLGMEAQAVAKGAGKGVSMWDVLLNRSMPEYGKGAQALYGKGLKDFSSLSSGDKMRLARSTGYQGGVQSGIDEAARRALAQGIPSKSLGADLSYWMKGAPTAQDLKLAEAGGIPSMLQAMKLPFKFWPTAAPLMGGMYAARETRKQAWERIKNERRQQLAWMYGVDPSEITGEMTNPIYDVSAPDLDWKYAPTATVNRGGIMDLDAGGDVSGPGTGTSDSINAKLSDGEFVMTAKAVENFGGGSRQAGANKMYQLMNQLDPQSETPQEGMS